MSTDHLVTDILACAETLRPRTRSADAVARASETALLAVDGCFGPDGVLRSLRTLKNACACASMLDREDAWISFEAPLRRAVVRERWRQWRRTFTPCCLHPASSGRRTPTKSPLQEITVHSSTC